MSVEDAVLASALNHVILPLLAGAFLAFMLYRNYKWLHKWIFAKIYGSFFTHLAERKLYVHKEDLFADLLEVESLDWELRNKGLIRILEIGVGPGTNFKYYPKNCRLVCYDPNPYFRSYLFENAEQFPEVKLERLVVAGGENLVGTSDESVDVIVTSLCMCSVQDINAVLKEILRVLPKGGKYYFLEHIRRPAGTVGYYVQTFLNPMWQAINACDLTRDIGSYVQKSGFSDVQIKNVVADLPPPFREISGLLVLGVATK